MLAKKDVLSIAVLLNNQHAIAHNMANVAVEPNNQYERDIRLAAMHLDKDLNKPLARFRGHYASGSTYWELPDGSTVTIKRQEPTYSNGERVSVKVPGKSYAEEPAYVDTYTDDGRIVATNLDGVAWEFHPSTVYPVRYQ
jgi:hypothetical protein